MTVTMMRMRWRKHYVHSTPRACLKSCLRYSPIQRPRQVKRAGGEREGRAGRRTSSRIGPRIQMKLAPQDRALGTRTALVERSLVCLLVENLVTSLDPWHA